MITELAIAAVLFFFSGVLLTVGTLVLIPDDHNTIDDFGAKLAVFLFGAALLLAGVFFLVQHISVGGAQ